MNLKKWKSYKWILKSSQETLNKKQKQKEKNNVAPNPKRGKSLQKPEVIS